MSAADRDDLDPDADDPPPEGCPEPPCEPLLPIERTLILGSLLLGLVLLGFLLWASATFFPTSGPALAP